MLQLYRQDPTCLRRAAAKMYAAEAANSEGSCMDMPARPAGRVRQQRWHRLRACWHVGLRVVRIQALACAHAVAWPNCKWKCLALWQHSTCWAYCRCGLAGAVMRQAWQTVAADAAAWRTVATDAAGVGCTGRRRGIDQGWASRQAPCTLTPQLLAVLTNQPLHAGSGQAGVRCQP